MGGWFPSGNNATLSEDGMGFSDKFQCGKNVLWEIRGLWQNSHGMQTNQGGVLGKRVEGGGRIPQIIHFLRIPYGLLYYTGSLKNIKLFFSTETIMQITCFVFYSQHI